MPYAKLAITVPDDVWLSDLSQQYSEVRFRILAATANGEKGFARLELFGPTAGQVCEQIATYEAVTDLTVFESETNRRRIQIETTMPLLFNAVQAAGIPLDFPVGVENGTLELETTVPREKLSQLAESLDSFDISYSVECIQQVTESQSVLTDRQEWLLRKAIEGGYYDTPRRITLVKLADEVGIAKSTCSEILHRAEGQVLKEFLDGDCQHQSNISITAD